MIRRMKESPKRNGWFSELRFLVSEQQEEGVHRPELSDEAILAWADAHFARTGDWPTPRSGTIAEAPGEFWMGVQAALYLGLRGLPGGWTLPQLLREHRGRFNRKGIYRITEDDILGWADAQRERTGEWPRPTPEVIPGTSGITWRSVNLALRFGRKGLPGGSSLAQLLTERRGVRHATRPPRLTEEQVVTWADAHFARDGQWPHSDSGPIPGANDETWCAVDKALRNGRRGLPGGSSLARLLSQTRGAFYVKEPPALSIEQILRWADAWHQRSGKWPTAGSDRVPGRSGLRWSFVDDALREGRCGLSGGSTLAKLLAAERGVRPYRRKRELTEQEILEWADLHYWRTGRWPTRDSGPIVGQPQNTWSDIEQRLKRGGRGLPGGSSLARLLAEHRGKRNRGKLPLMRIDDILAWADAFRERTGQWPQSRSGPIAEAPGETWGAVQAALSNGTRGFSGSSSLARLLAEHRGVYNPHGPRVLNEAQIVAWADAWHARAGRWPHRTSGAIPDAGGLTWGAVEQALRDGTCGLPGGSTIRRLLASRRDVRRAPRTPHLTEEQILAWADEHFRQTHTWPKVRSGSIFGADGEAWHNIENALRFGLLGLPGGSSLARLLTDKRGVRTARPRSPRRTQADAARARG